MTSTPTPQKKKSNRYAQRMAKLKLKHRKNKVLTIMPGCLYWDITYQPIGNRFLRAPDAGLKVGDITQLPAEWHKCNRTGFTLDGVTKIAFHTDYTLEHYNDK